MKVESNHCIDQVEAQLVMSEFDFPSRVPVLGPLIRAVRKLWNGVSARWYVRHYVEQQARFNEKVLCALKFLAGRQGLSTCTNRADELCTLETVSRQHAQAIYLGDRTVLCRVLNKYMMYVDADDVGIMPHLCLNGYWESWVTRVMIDTLKHNWYCLDVGANHGYYTLIMAGAVGPGGRVLAVEPTPRLIDLMKSSLMVNGVQHYVTALQKAVSDLDASKTGLVIPKKLGMNATLCGEITEWSDSTIEVETTTLDCLTHDWPHVDFVKIDVEGAEEAIWRGMQNMLARNPDIIVILEINCQRYANPLKFMQEIVSQGFKLRYIDYDSTIKNATADQFVTERMGEDWMLFLQRS